MQKLHSLLQATKQAPTLQTAVRAVLAQEIAQCPLDPPSILQSALAEVAEVHIWFCLRFRLCIVIPRSVKGHQQSAWLAAIGHAGQPQHVCAP